MGTSNFMGPSPVGHYIYFLYRVNTSGVKSRLIKKGENGKSSYCKNNFKLQKQLAIPVKNNICKMFHYRFLAGF